jgi:hypothetical protein
MGKKWIVIIIILIHFFFIVVVVYFICLTYYFYGTGTLFFTDEIFWVCMVSKLTLITLPSLTSSSLSNWKSSKYYNLLPY